MRSCTYLVRALLLFHFCGDISLCIGLNSGISGISAAEIQSPKKTYGKVKGGRWNRRGVQANPNDESVGKQGPKHWRGGGVGTWRNAMIIECRNSKAFSPLGGVRECWIKIQDKIARGIMRWRGGSISSNGMIAGSSNGDGGRIPIEVFKAILSLFLMILNVTCWLLPMRIKHLQESNVLGLANAFSGGVFLSLAFGHMIPHAHEDLAKSGYPLSTSLYLALGGYLLIFLVEKIMFNTEELMHSDESSNARTVSKDQAIMNEGGSGKSGFILLVALGIHSLFETMAVGLSDTKMNAALTTMSIAIHQPAESLALLVALLNNGLPRATVFRALSVFSCISPLGMLLGTAMSEHAGPLAVGTVVALAAGTFIYVGATEMIAEEFEKNEDTWKKFGALAFGVVGIAFITNWVNTIESFT